VRATFKGWEDELLKLRAWPKADPQLPEVAMTTGDNPASLQLDELCDAEGLLVGVAQAIATRVLGGIRDDEKSLRNPTLNATEAANSGKMGQGRKTEEVCPLAPVVGRSVCSVRWLIDIGKRVLPRIPISGR
jgi:hypothetical protein